MSLLSGVRVLELTVAWAGPLAGKLLGDLGADVIHVEHMTARGAGMPTGIDPTTEWEWGTLPEPISRSGVFPNADPGKRPWNRQAIFNKHNRNKRSLCIDLKKPEGRAVFHRLSKDADVVLDNYSPRVMKELGIDYEQLRTINPSIISISMSGYGHTGPFANRISYGPILEAHSGLASISGAGDAPLKLGAAFPDAIGGVTGAFAIAAALVHRDETGEGQFIDLSQLETYCSVAGDAFLYQSLTDEPIDPVEWAALEFGIPHGSFECADKQWLSIAVETEEQWTRIAPILETIEPSKPQGWLRGVDRFRNVADVEVTLARWCAARPRTEACRELQCHEIPAYPVLSNGELLRDEHLASRGMFVEFEQDDVGPIAFPAFPVRTADGHDPATYRSSPGLGAHNEEILRDQCGMDAEEIEELKRAGVIGREPVVE